MEEHEIACCLTSSFRLPDDVVDVAIAVGDDWLVAYRAVASLCFPQYVLALDAGQGLPHGHT